MRLTISLQCAAFLSLLFFQASATRELVPRVAGIFKKLEVFPFSRGNADNFFISTKLIQKAAWHDESELLNYSPMLNENALSTATASLWDTTPKMLLKKVSPLISAKPRLELFATAVDYDDSDMNLFCNALGIVARLAGVELGEVSVADKMQDNMKALFAPTIKFTTAMQRPGQIAMVATSSQDNGHGAAPCFYISLGKQRHFIPKENEAFTIAGTLVLAVDSDSPIYHIFKNTDGKKTGIDRLRQKRAEWYAENLVNGKYIVDPIHRGAIGLTLLAVAATSVGAAAVAYKKGALKRKPVKAGAQETETLESAWQEVIAQ